MKFKYPNSLPFIFAAVAAIPFASYYFALMFGELVFGRPSSTWAIGFVWIPFLLFRPALAGFIFGSLLWLFFRWQKKSGEVPRKVSLALFILLVLLSLFGVGTGLRKVDEHEHYHAPEVSLGKDLLDKEQFLTNGKLTEIESITRDNSDGTERLIVIGETGALYPKLKAEPEAFIPFDKSVGETIPVDVDGNGTLAFMNRGGGWQPVSLLDASGRTLWLYPSADSLIGGSADSMAAGDLNKDGRLEFVVGMNAGGGLHVLDAKGKELWKKDAGNVFSVEVLDKGPNGTPVILHSDAGKGIVVRKADGTQIKTIKNCGDGHFSLLDQSGTDSRPLLVCDDGGLRLVDLNDNIIKKFSLPGGGHAPKGTLIYFDGPNNPPSYAFVRTVQATGRRSDLTIFNNNGTLIYHEKIEASYLAISRLPENDKADTLLVGENSRVWAYRMRLHN
jgi:hypothetical protein